ncbi:hypothetical protein BV22DRAFT_502185 [Leucogyrophana mollusca]|uniref:Uncharacterized protein n=1 Tax=Leucogyrophana mollusca TaxID=85980 RepID=A0ACB8BFE6_9AGAM|nr:hypothetical protein BV22DRAFT_502185 [Leucogyrophana mollusca]
MPALASPTILSPILQFASLISNGVPVRSLPRHQASCRGDQTDDQLSSPVTVRMRHSNNISLPEVSCGDAPSSQLFIKILPFLSKAHRTHNNQMHISAAHSSMRGPGYGVELDSPY